MNKNQYQAHIYNVFMLYDKMLVSIHCKGNLERRFFSKKQDPHPPTPSSDLLPENILKNVDWNKGTVENFSE